MEGGGAELNLAVGSALPRTAFLASTAAAAAWAALTTAIMAAAEGCGIRKADVKLRGGSDVEEW